mgnify:CR=1 FL=1
MMKTIKILLSLAIVFAGCSFASNAQINSKLKNKLANKVQAINTSGQTKTTGSQETKTTAEEENKSEVVQSEPETPVIEEKQPEKILLPEYFSTPSHKYLDKEITEAKIAELFKKYERDCAVIQKIWIGSLDASEEWYTFTHDNGIPDFMRTKRYFSIVFKDKNGKCYYTWNNLAMARDYMGGGKFGEMYMTSVKYKRIEIDCADVQ